jgi:hypothetical protein
MDLPELVVAAAALVVLVEELQMQVWVALVDLDNLLQFLDRQ